MMQRIQEKHSSSSVLSDWRNFCGNVTKNVYDPWNRNLRQYFLRTSNYPVNARSSVTRIKCSQLTFLQITDTCKVTFVPTWHNMFMCQQGCQTAYSSSSHTTGYLWRHLGIFPVYSIALLFYCVFWRRPADISSGFCADQNWLCVIGSQTISIHDHGIQTGILRQTMTFSSP